MLTIDNGFGVVAQATIAVPPPPPPGWTEQAGLETLQAANLNNDPGNANLAVFAGRLWCGQATLGGPLLFSTPDGSSSWTSVSAHGLPSSYGRPSIDALLVADLGEGETLWAFGNAPDDYTPYVAKSADGISWECSAPAALSPALVRSLCGRHNGCLLGHERPDLRRPRYATDLAKPRRQTLDADRQRFSERCLSGGRCVRRPAHIPWTGRRGGSCSRRTTARPGSARRNWTTRRAITTHSSRSPAELGMIGAFGGVFTMNKGGVWTTLGGLPPDDGRFSSGLLYSAALSDHIWAACVDDNGLPRFYMFNALLPGTIIASITPGPTKMAQAPTGR